jgi:hypothetical protein
MGVALLLGLGVGGIFLHLKGFSIFAVFASPLLFVMQASHRWAHYPPSFVPGWVGAMQEYGLLLDREAHSVHHADYALNFAIFTGWTNPILNMLVTQIMHAKHPAWVYVLPLWIVFPMIISLVANRNTNRKVDVLLPWFAVEPRKDKHF